jgi:hypothetical protein
MRLKEFKTTLRRQPDKHLRFVLPGGASIPADFHITEVGHVTKNFVDCGGTVRETSSCLLQAWVARNDPDHRLTAGKLSSILDLSDKVIPSDELDVEVEYEGRSISQYTVLKAEAASTDLTFTLGSKHTDCLAREACGLESCGCGPSASECC